MRDIAVCLGLLSLACSTAPNEGLDAWVTLDRTRLVRGEAVTITVAVANGTLRGSSSCLVGYNVLDGTGAVVAPIEEICTSDLTKRSVGRSPYVRQFSWAGYTGMSTNGRPLPPGTYQIVGGTGGPGEVQGSVSEPVSLELVE